MNNEILWVGPAAPEDSLARSIEALPARLRVYETTAEALADTTGGDVVAAVLVLGPDPAREAARALRAQWPRLEIVLVSSAAVTDEVRSLLAAGVTRLAEPSQLGDGGLPQLLAEFVAQVQAGRSDRELLQRVRALNEQFLKNLVMLEKRNLQLEDQLGDPDDSEDETDRLRIMVVDDEPNILRLFEMVLEDDYDVVTVEDAETGLERLRAERFHILITDKNLPGMSGLDLLRVIKQEQPQIEVVLITAFGSKESAIEALNLGARAFLEKPFADVSVILERIEEVSSQQRQAIRNRSYLRKIKERNSEFLSSYQEVRRDLDARIGSGASPRGPRA